MSSQAQVTPGSRSSRVLSERSFHVSQITTDCAVLIAALGLAFIAQRLFAVRFAVGTTLLSTIALTLLLAFSIGSASTDSPLDIRATEHIVRGLGIYLVLALPIAIFYTKHQVMVSGAALVTSFAAGLGSWHAKSARLSPPPQAGLLASIVKRSIDVLTSAFLLVLLAPLFVFVSILIVTDSRGPVFFRHDRVGRGGQLFPMWKFRSMHIDAPCYQRSPLSDNDPRLTRVGRVLRRYSFDELPQLINVFRGEMSLVGPRPEMPFIVQQYGAKERQRVAAKPGITGLWQISPARACPIHEHMEYDLYYIAEQNVFLDIAIMIRTVTAVFRGIGAT